jgi:hypothetical protein
MMGTVTVTNPLEQLYNFFWVYYGEKVAKNVRRHPEVAIPIIKEAIQSGLQSRAALNAYADAFKLAVSVQGDSTGKKKKKPMSR